MAVVPTVTNLPSGVLDSSQLNSGLVAAVNFLMAKPVAHLRQAVVQSLSNNTATPITFDTEDEDTAGGHSTSVNTTRYTAVYDGIYLVSGGIGYAANATGVRLAEIWVNGAAINGGGVLLSTVSAFTFRLPTRTIPIQLHAGDYVEIVAYQNSGGALNTAVGTLEQSNMSIVWQSLLP